MCLMNKLSTAKRVSVVAALVEGNSIRSTSRMTNVSKPTILKLLAELGAACAKFQNDAIRNVAVRRVQVDEIWQFVYAKARNVPDDKRGQFGYGDVWTWVAIDADSKLILSWRLGPRDIATAYDLMHDLAARVRGRIQLTTDGLKLYIDAVDSAFENQIDFAMLSKIYRSDAAAAKRYSPANIISSLTEVITGDPNPRHISTSYIERQNLTMRMSMRRFTRLTNGFSKKVENHAAAVALHYMHYNFSRVHQTLRVTPAIQAGLTDHVWALEEIVALLDSESRTRIA
jgi:IS1 family transposase